VNGGTAVGKIGGAPCSKMRCDHAPERARAARDFSKFSMSLRRPHNGQIYPLDGGQRRTVCSRPRYIVLPADDAPCELSPHLREENGEGAVTPARRVE